MMSMDNSDAVEPSLDELSQAFAEAMGHSNQKDVQPEPEPSKDTPLPAEESVHEAVDDNCPISPKAILEAVLFVGHPDNAPITSATVAKLLRGVEKGEVDDLVVELNEEYTASELPIFIASLDDGYRIELGDEYDHVRQRFYGRVRQARLSQFAVDVLAIVAYNQPVTRQEIDKLLNNSRFDARRVLSQLVRRELISQQVTDDKPERKEYVTTDRFLSLFDLGEIGDLPRSEDPQ